MNVSVLSFFRNSGENGQAAAFIRRAAQLRDELAFRRDRMRVVAVWGDSVDNTYQSLINNAISHELALTLVRADHGGPVFGSTEHPNRLRALSKIANAGLDAILPQDEVVLYVESDLLWDPKTVLALMGQLREGVDVVSPLVFAGTLFYDVFVFRKNGQRFSPFHPYHSELNHEGLTHVDSVGSCLVMKAEVARKCRVRNENVLMGFCEDVWRNGYTVNVDATQRIYHP